MAPSCFEVILVGFILVLPFLYETSRTFRYYFKFLIYYGIVMMNAVLLIPVFSLRPGNVKNFLSVPDANRSISLRRAFSRTSALRISRAVPVLPWPSRRLFLFLLFFFKRQLDRYHAKLLLWPRELLTSGSSVAQSERRCASGDNAEGGGGGVVRGGCCERVT